MMSRAAFEIARLAVVIVLLVAAALIATPKGRVPLALRGVYRILRKDRGLAVGATADKGRPVSSSRRCLAFGLVLAAVALAVIPT